MRLSATRSPARAPARDRPARGRARPVGHFALHVLEMCVVVMCIGGGLLSLLFFGLAALLGFSDLKQTAPELTIMVIAVNFAIATVVWMRLRRMEWRPTLEMAGSSVAVGLLMVAASWLGAASTSALIGAECALACVGMVAVMLFRFRLYAGLPAQRAHAG